MSIPFTQYIRPDGRRIETFIKRPGEVERVARKLIDLGYVFESEVLRDGRVSLTCEYRGEPDPITAAIEIETNGILVLSAVDRLVQKAWAFAERRKGKEDGEG